MDPFLRLSLGESRARKRPGASEIVEAIAAQIASGGDALEGCRLPPIRVLAHQLGVSKNTVASAYDELKARGLVEARDKRGLYVSRPEGVVPSPSRAVVPVAPPALREPPALVRATLAAAGKELPLSASYIDPALLPKDRLAACFRSALKRPGLSDFSDPRGFLPLRRVIAERLRRRGIDAGADDVITTIGSQHALDLVAHAIETRVVATEDPAYHMGKALWERSGLDVVGLRLDPFNGIDLDAWRATLGLTRPGLLHLTPTFQNPTGYSFSSGELAAVLAMAREHGFGLLEDDWGSEILSFSEFRPSLRALGGRGVLYVNSFTKKLLPSLRVGYVLGDERTVPALLAAKRVSLWSSPAIGEAALCEFLEGGYYDAHLRAVQPELDRRYRRCLTLLHQTMPECVRWTSPGGGTVLWLDVPRAVSLSLLSARLLARGVRISPLLDSFFGEPHLHGFRIGYAFLPPAEMERAIGILAEELRVLLTQSASHAVAHA